MINRVRRRRQRRLLPDRKARKRAGFAMVEAMVALILFAIGALGLAAMSVAVARRAISSAAATARAAAVGEQLDRLQSVPFDSIQALSGCTEVNGPPLPHTRCVVVTVLPNNKVQIRLVVTPHDSNQRPDTVVFTRARGSKKNPLI